jgi:TRAP-type C4-dicarboxylate transport system substrate-binding protein
MMTRSLDKKGLGLLAVMILALVLSGFSICESAAAPKAKELKWALFFPETAYQGPITKKLRDDIETFTKGAIKPKLYWVGQIAETKDLPDLCRRGSIDMASTAPVYTPTIFPLNSALQMFPVIFKTPEHATYTWRGLLHNFPEIQQEYAKQNQYCINRTCLALYRTLSRNPIRKVADFKGVKIRTFPGKYCSEWMKSIGAININFPLSEIYEALMRRVADAVVVNAQYMESLKYYEVAKYVSFNFGTIVAWQTTVNLDVWNSFTPEIKEAFTRAATAFGARDLELNVSSEKKSMEFVKTKGVQFINVDEKEMKDFMDKAGDPWGGRGGLKDTLVNDLKVDAGVADRFIKQWRGLADEYEKKYLSTGKEWEYK